MVDDDVFEKPTSPINMDAEERSFSNILVSFQQSPSKKRLPDVSLAICISEREYDTTTRGRFINEGSPKRIRLPDGPLE